MAGRFGTYQKTTGKTDTKLRFRTTRDFTPKLGRLAQSSLAPCQKLEVLRRHLMPWREQRHASSGREWRKFMSNVYGVAINAAKAFLC